MVNKKDLVFHNLNHNYGLILDPDNVFWAIVCRRQDNIIFPGQILSFYENAKDKLDAQMSDFRFSANLTAIYINPTDRCNANCPYCYIPEKIRKYGRSMTKEELTLILNKIAEYFYARGGVVFSRKKQKRKPVIVFHASEPLLVKDTIFKAIKAHKDIFHFGLQTNAILLEKKDVEFLKEHRVGIGISLDSHLSSVNNRLRPSCGLRGNFESALKAIEWFDGYEGLNVIATITKFNVTGLANMVKFLHNKNVPCVLLNPVRFTQRTSFSLKPDELIMTKYFIEAVNQAIELSRSSHRRIIIGNFTNIILGIVAPTARRLMCDISPCGGGRCFLTITASGEMIPCGEFIGLNGFSGGNIFSAKGGSAYGGKTAIEQAIQSKPFRKVRSRIVEKISECKTCIFRNICGAPCPAELHSLGSMYRVAIFCEFYKEIIKHAFKLIAIGKEKYCFREKGLDNLKYEYNLGGLG
jgi:uncharacterized protein